MKLLGLIAICLFFSFTIKAETFTVSNNLNSGPGSIRDAILKANANGTAVRDLIYFNIVASSENEITINLSEELPALTTNLIIDATTQPNALIGNTSIKIKLIRASTSYFNGLVLDGVSDIEIYGLYFSNFLSETGAASDDRKAGIYLKNTNQITIGAPNKQNGFGNNYTSIISPTFPNYQRNITISSNIIGLDPTGEIASENIVAIDLSYLSNSTIGGPSEAYGNLISSNLTGISLGGSSGNISISYNVIGFNQYKTKSFPKDQSTGLFISGEPANITINDNYIVSQFVGIRVYNVKNEFQIKRNFIGVGLNSSKYGNKKFGIEIYSCKAGIIGGLSLTDENIIANNEQAIQIDNSYPVSILKNSIYCNSKSAIEFKDLPNGSIITPSKINFVDGNSVNGIYLPNSIIELFLDDECPDCQGKTWIATIPTNADGSWSYNGAINGGLTSTGTNADGATSSFSKPIILDNNIKITDVYCGSINGSIKGLNISDANFFEWYDSNDQLVANTIDLVNVASGAYYLKTGQMGACQVVSKAYNIKDINLIFAGKTIQSIPANCNLNNGSLKVVNYQNSVPVVFIWTNSLGEIVSNNEVLNNMPAGNYTLTASNGLGCINQVGTYSIALAQPPVIDLSQLQYSSSCDGKLISVENISVISETIPLTYQWRNESGNIISNDLLFNNVPLGKYYLHIKDRLGCEVKTHVIDFTESKNKGLTIPNSITPNGDGVNDKWKINGSQNYPSAEFSVYNRNGARVFFSKGYLKEFDGHFNGMPLSSGVYFYLIDLKDICGKLSGSLTILR